MLKICLVFWESEPQYAYKRYAYKKKHVHVLKGAPLKHNSEPHFCILTVKTD